MTNEPPMEQTPDEIVYELGNETCRGVFVARLPDFSEADRWLPPGFQPADASSVIKEAGLDIDPTGKAFMGTFAGQCETFSFNNYWIAVDPPSLADQEGLHWYELAAFQENGKPTIGLHGANVAEFTSAFNFDDTGGSFEGTDTETILDAVALGAAFIFSLDQPLHFWQVTETGTLVLEGFVNTKAQSGDATCTTAYDWIQEFLNDCTGDDVISGTLPTMQFGGTYRFFEDQFPR